MVIVYKEWRAKKIAYGCECEGKKQDSPFCPPFWRIKILFNYKRGYLRSTFQNGVKVAGVIGLGEIRTSLIGMKVSRGIILILIMQENKSSACDVSEIV